METVRVREAAHEAAHKDRVVVVEVEARPGGERQAPHELVVTASSTAKDEPPRQEVALRSLY